MMHDDADKNETAGDDVVKCRRYINTVRDSHDHFPKSC
jgi:hypothetical protein